MFTEYFPPGQDDIHLKGGWGNNSTDMGNGTDSIALLHHKIAHCTLCASQLPLGPRPVVQFSAASRVLIASQAPGKAVHNSGIPFDDPSGKRLREWLGVSKETFYDDRQFALLPMGFCYPGTGKSGDLAPRKECAQKWRGQVLASLNNIQLTLVIGQYAMGYHLPKAKGTLTETIRNWPGRLPTQPLPHPSPRNNIWLKRNPWFLQNIIPQLQKTVQIALTHKQP